MNRINQIANFINNSQCVYDVGSDHALLAIALLKEKRTRKVINIDINYKPLKIGLVNLAKNHLTTKTLNVENDGLKNISKKVLVQPDYICIAGLGGLTIIDILKTKDVKVNPRATYILQPNTDAHELRKWLAKNKWEITKELTCIDRNKYYQIIETKLSDKVRKINKLEAYFGANNVQVDKELWHKYIIDTSTKLVKNKIDKFNKEFQDLVKQINKEFAKGKK